MQFNSLGELLLLVLLITLNAFFVVTETALVGARRSRLRQLRNEGARWVGLVEALAEDSHTLLTTVCLGTILAKFAAAASAVLVLVPPVSAWLTGIFSIASTATPLAAIFVVVISWPW